VPRSAGPVTAKEDSTLTVEEVRNPAVWAGGQLHKTDWIIDVDPGELKSGPIGKDLTSRISESPWRHLAGMVRERLENGPGVTLIRGLNVQQLELREASAFLLMLGGLLGTPRPQNREGTVVFDVVDDSAEATGKAHGHVRGANSNVLVRLHTENDGEPKPPRLVVFLCIAQAASGGETLLASGQLAHNILLKASSSSARLLYEPIAFARRPEDYDPTMTDLDSVFTPLGDRVRVRYSRYWIRRAAEIRGEPHDRATAMALSALDETLQDARLATSVRLHAGALLAVNNQFVLHGRAPFSDDGTAARRHLMRVWID
jgi:alpha-ketoglutarate-dependent taurine dioxygenase